MISNSINLTDIRKFGLMAFLFFGLLCALGFWKQRPVPIYLFGAFSVLGIGFIFLPLQLKPVYVLWIKLTHYVGRIVTKLILSLAYYLVITPSALLKGLFGGAPLPVKPDKKSSSYWVIRSEPAQPIERFKKRY